MQTEQSAEAMKHDGVNPDTLVVLAEGQDFALAALRAEIRRKVRRGCPTGRGETRPGGEAGGSRDVALASRLRSSG
jgi:hypothetical protein